MLRIETKGSPRQMGQQLGEAFREWFPQLFNHFAKWLLADLNRFRPVIREIDALLLCHAPELHEETLGLAEAVGVEFDLMLGYRYFNELRQRLPPGCSGLFIAASDRGPLLARTCDIEPDIGAETQVLWLKRPAQGQATLIATYLGMTGGVGINEAGLGLVGSSASAKPPAQPVAGSDQGLPTALFNYLLLNRCHNLAEARALFQQYRPKGKGANQILADAQGHSMLVELIPGREIRCTERRPDRDWQACSNFCYSADLTPANNAAYQADAYARYGRIAHQVDDYLMPRTVAGVKQLFTEIAQPGMVRPLEHCSFHTAYAFVLELAHRRMHLTPGHPAKHPWLEISL